jgi:hypothetical protein
MARARRVVKPSKRLREQPTPVLPRLPDYQPLYQTQNGYAVVADSLAYMRGLPAESIDLVMTSPPFALKRKKDYGNVEAEQYIATGSCHSPTKCIGY